jgi:hypothetical protein
MEGTVAVRHVDVKIILINETSQRDHGKFSPVIRASDEFAIHNSNARLTPWQGSSMLRGTALVG